MRPGDSEAQRIARETIAAVRASEQATLNPSLAPLPPSRRQVVAGPLAGRWTTCQLPEGFNPVHASVLPDGTVLLMAGSGNDPAELAAGRFQSYLSCGCPSWPAAAAGTRRRPSWAAATCSSCPASTARARSTPSRSSTTTAPAAGASRPTGSPWRPIPTCCQPPGTAVLHRRGLWRIGRPGGVPAADHRQLPAGGWLDTNRRDEGASFFVPFSQGRKVMVAGGGVATTALVDLYASPNPTYPTCGWR